MEKACPGLVVDYFGGQCPVQAWGTLLGFPFYFRARHAHWSFAVAKVGEDPTMDGVPAFLFKRVERWGELDAHEQECTGDVCIVRNVSIEHAIDRIDENSVQAPLGGGAYGVGNVVIRFVERDGRRLVEARASSAPSPQT